MKEKKRLHSLSLLTCTRGEFLWDSPLNIFQKLHVSVQLFFVLKKMPV